MKQTQKKEEYKMKCYWGQLYLEYYKGITPIDKLLDLTRNMPLFNQSSLCSNFEQEVNNGSN